MNKLVVSLSLMMVLNAAYAGIYKWIDRQGHVHFSDTARPGAEKLNIPDAQGFSSPVSPSSAPEKLEPNLIENGRTYTKIAITQPENEATIRNNEGFIAVTVQVDPELFPGDRLQLLFDGAPFGEPQVSSLFQLSGIYRGSHNIAVQVMDAEGNVLNRSDSITVFLFKPHVNMRPNG